MKSTLVLVVTTLALAGCHTGPVGAACSSSQDCQNGLLCADNFPGGYCFEECTTRPTICPYGSKCVTVGISSRSQCYDICFADTECRLGYACYPLSNQTSGVGVCLPR